MMRCGNYSLACSGPTFPVEAPVYPQIKGQPSNNFVTGLFGTSNVLWIASVGGYSILKHDSSNLIAMSIGLVNGIFWFIFYRDEQKKIHWDFGEFIQDFIEEDRASLLRPLNVWGFLNWIGAMGFLSYGIAKNDKSQFMSMGACLVNMLFRMIIYAKKKVVCKKVNDVQLGHINLDEQVETNSSGMIDRSAQLLEDGPQNRRLIDSPESTYSDFQESNPFGLKPIDEEHEVEFGCYLEGRV